MRYIQQSSTNYVNCEIYVNNIQQQSYVKFLPSDIVFSYYFFH